MSEDSIIHQSREVISAIRQIDEQLRANPTSTLKVTLTVIREDEEFIYEDEVSVTYADASAIVDAVSCFSQDLISAQKAMVLAQVDDDA